MDNESVGFDRRSNRGGAGGFTGYVFKSEDG